MHIQRVRLLVRLESLIVTLVCYCCHQQMKGMLQNSISNRLLFWEDGKNQTKFADYIADESSLQLLASNNILVITGSLIIHQEEVLERVTPYVTIFARMSPQQKGDVIRYTKQKGDYCLMCGDGTNDVAALKQAHIGVSIMSNVDLEDKIANAEKKLLNNEEGETEKVEPPILHVHSIYPFHVDGSCEGWKPSCCCSHQTSCQETTYC